MPIFAQIFGIRPWEMDLLYYEDFCILERAAIQVTQQRKG